MGRRIGSEITGRLRRDTRPCQEIDGETAQCGQGAIPWTNSGIFRDVRGFQKSRAQWGVGASDATIMTSS